MPPITPTTTPSPKSPAPSTTSHTPDSPKAAREAKVIPTTASPTTEKAPPTISSVAPAAKLGRFARSAASSPFGSRGETVPWRDPSCQGFLVRARGPNASRKASTLDRLAVRAPLDAEVLQVKVRRGELYTSQGTEPLVVMGDSTKLRVRMDVDERDIAKVAVGARART